jgi:DNA-binding NarL/FixJ family response regulator
MTIHIVLADDEVLARQKLRSFLRDEPDCEVAGEGASAAETVELAAAIPTSSSSISACPAWTDSM